MSSEKATAIVLRAIEFSETSSIVTLFTREFGKIQALAKGARRPKGPFESALDLLCLCRIVFLRKSSDSLDLLTEAKLERRFRPHGNNLSNLYAGYFVAELLNQLTDDYDSHPELFDAANETLLALRTSDAAARWLLRFEMTALRLVGHLPALEICVECGQPVESTGRVLFSHEAGGVLCKSCRANHKQIVQVTAGALKVLVRFANPDEHGWRRTEFDRRSAGELRGLLNHIWSHQFGRPPRMQRYIAGLQP